MSWRRISSLLIVFGFIVAQGCNCSGKTSAVKKVEDDVVTKQIDTTKIESLKKDITAEKNSQAEIDEDDLSIYGNAQVEILENDTIVKFYDENQSFIEEVNLVEDNPWLDYFSDKSVSKLKHGNYTDIDLGRYKLTKEEAKLIYSEDRDPAFTKFKGVTFLRTILGRVETDINEKALVANYRMFGFNALDEVVSVRSLLGVFQVKDGLVQRKFIDIGGDAIEFMIEPNLNLIFAQGGGLINENGGKITNSRIYKIDLDSNYVTILMEGKEGENFSPIAFDQPNWISFHKDYKNHTSWKRELFIYNTKSHIIRSKIFLDPLHAPQRIVNDSLQIWEASSVAVSNLNVIQ